MLIKPNMRYSYPQAACAIGTRINGINGQQWLDGASGAIACSIGHGNKHVVEAIKAQLEKTTFLYRTQFTSEPAENLARRLCKKLGYGGAFFVNSGSEAVEAAIRIAVQFWRDAGRPQKTKILSRRLSYHGSTVGALELSGHWPRRRAAGPLSGEPTLPTPFCFRCPLGHKVSSCELACANVIEQEIGRYGADSIAALIIEPIVGASGAAILPPPGYLSRVRDICDKNDIILIADEVLTGLGRTGRWLAMNHADVKADIVCLGKGLNAGYIPISGILITENIYRALRDGSGNFPLGHTHSNHPVAAAAANAVLDVLENEDLISRSETVGAILGNRLRTMASGHPSVGDIRGIGMLWGLELVADGVSKKPFPVRLKAADLLVENAFSLGLVIYPSSGFAADAGGDAIIVAPPLNITLPDIEIIIDLLDRALAKTNDDLFQKMEAHDAA